MCTYFNIQYKSFDIAPNILYTILFMYRFLRNTWTELTRPVTLRPTQFPHDAFTGYARQRYDLIGCSKTGAVGARSVCEHSRWKMHVCSELDFSLVHVLWTKLKSLFTDDGGSIRKQWNKNININKGKGKESTRNNKVYDMRRLSHF